MIRRNEQLINMRNTGPVCNDKMLNAHSQNMWLVIIGFGLIICTFHEHTGNFRHHCLWNWKPTPNEHYIFNDSTSSWIGNATQNYLEFQTRESKPLMLLFISPSISAHYFRFQLRWFQITWLDFMTLYRKSNLSIIKEHRKLFFKS